MTKKVILKGKGFITKCETMPDQNPSDRFPGDRGYSSVTIQWAGPHTECLHETFGIKGEFELSIVEQGQQGPFMVCEYASSGLDIDCWTIVFQESLPFHLSYPAYKTLPFKKAQAVALVKWLNKCWAERIER